MQRLVFVKLVMQVTPTHIPVKRSFQSRRCSLEFFPLCHSVTSSHHCNLYFTSRTEIVLIRQISERIAVCFYLHVAIIWFIAQPTFSSVLQLRNCTHRMQLKIESNSNQHIDQVGFSKPIQNDTKPITVFTHLPEYDWTVGPIKTQSLHYWVPNYSEAAE